MRYFLYHHKVVKDSFTGMPSNFIVEWDEGKMTLYSPDGSRFNMDVAEPGIDSSIFRGELEEMEASDFAKYLLTAGDSGENSWPDRLDKVH